MTGSAVSSTLAQRAISLSEDTLAVGAQNEASASVGVNGDEADNHAARAGAAYVFVRSGEFWSQQAYLKASNTGTEDRFGTSIALAGDSLAIGAPGEASAAAGINGDQDDNGIRNAGAVYVFRRGDATWTQQAYLKASHVEYPIRFGESVALSRDALVVGAPSDTSSATGINGDQSNFEAHASGAIYAFR